MVTDFTSTPSRPHGHRAKKLDFHSFKAQLLSPDVSGITLGTEGTKLSSSASATDE